MADILRKWRPVVGYEDLYEVSTSGEVRTLATQKVRTGSSDSSGYMQITLSRKGMYQNTRVHTLVLTAFVGPPPLGTEGCHNNGDPADNRLTNLRWDTKSNNALDQVTHGTHNNAKRTRCANGHEYTPENTRIDGNIRWCRTCRATINKRSKAKRRAALRDAATAEAVPVQRVRRMGRQAT